jgi:5'-phosphate synthase pdxT subunit
MIFIRAPRIQRLGESVEVLVQFEGEPVMVREGNVYGASFHPELTEDRRVHQLVFKA